MERVDRRQFMQKAGIAGAAAGALWVAPSVLGSSTAFAVGSCVNHATLNWASLGTGGNMGATDTGATVNGFAVIPASGTSPAIRVNMSVVPIGTPGGGNPDGIVNQQFGGQTSTFYKLSMTNNAANEGFAMTFTFRNAANTANVSVYQLAYTLVDIDRYNPGGNGFQDKVNVSPVPTPAQITSQGSEVNGTGTVLDPFVGTGNTDVPANSPNGNVTITYPGPIQTFTFNYLSGNVLNFVQSIGILNLGWCY